MRPINRGDVPTNITVTKFSQYKSGLLDSIGTYCSYCERYQAASLAVEHKISKIHRSDLELRWDNLLLACVNCNSTKSDKVTHLDAHYWPDRDNTMLGFTYNVGGTISPSSDLSAEKQKTALSTIQLTGLDKLPSVGNASDYRWRERRTAWEKAKKAQSLLIHQDSIGFREIIVLLAISTGYFSVWMTVFEDDRDMKQRLIHAFPGTSLECFDENFKYKTRTGSLL